MSALVWPTTIPGLKISMGREEVDDVKVVATQSGRECRSTWQTYPRYRYTLDFELLRSGAQVEFQRIVGFYSRHRGALDSFLFTDDEDSSVTAHPFGIGDGVTTDFQLQRTLVPSADLSSPASRSYWPAMGDGYEPVFELNSAPSVFKDTGGGPVLQVLTTNYTIASFAVIRFSVAPAVGAILTWTGTYYRRVRFDSTMSTTRIVSTFWEARSIKLISVKPQEASFPVPNPLARSDSTSAGTLAGTINGTTGSDGNAAFTLSATPISGRPVAGYRSGIRLTSGTDFTVAGAAITMLAPNIPTTGESLVFDYYV